MISTHRRSLVNRGGPINNDQQPQEQPMTDSTQQPGWNPPGSENSQFVQLAQATRDLIAEAKAATTDEERDNALSRAEDMAGMLVADLAERELPLAIARQAALPIGALRAAAVPTVTTTVQKLAAVASTLPGFDNVDRDSLREISELLAGANPNQEAALAAAMGGLMHAARGDYLEDRPETWLLSACTHLLGLDLMFVAQARTHSDHQPQERNHG